MRTLARLLSALALAFTACADDDAPATTDAALVAPDAGAPDAVPLVPNLARDILSTDLELDLLAHTGRAVLAVLPSATATSASFDVSGLDIQSVDGEGGPLVHAIIDGRLDVAFPPGSATAITVVYGFSQRTNFDGLIAGGVTFLWPYFCGNLFPCHPDPADGARFDLRLVNVPDGVTAVYPDRIATDAPAYMVAFAVGDYTRTDLGTTSAGTSVHVWNLPGDPAGAASATARLKDEFEFLEETYGAYAFGSSAGSVSAAWGAGGYGGMEHHPYWHVGQDSMDDEVTHAHEAAHGWFGNGVRIQCWEDFVLSEGTVTYLAARAIGAAGGVAAEDAVWGDYQSELDYAVATGDTLAWPEGCNEIDILTDPLWSAIPYYKGAFFYLALEREVGRAALDAALAAFYVAHVGKAAGMQDLLDALHADTGFDPTPLATAWLRSLGTP